MHAPNASTTFLLAAAATSLLLTFVWHFRFRRRQSLLQTATTAQLHPLHDEKAPLRGDVETPNEAGAGACPPPPPPPNLPASVTASDPDTLGRDQWVLRLTRHVFGERHGGRHNVLVINDDLQYHFAPAGVVEEFRVAYREREHRRTVPYRVVVFASGELLNLGDGGDINWDWMGNFVRHNNAQLSFSPCKPAQEYQQDPWVATVKGQREWRGGGRLGRSSKRVL